MQSSFAEFEGYIFYTVYRVNTDLAKSSSFFFLNKDIIEINIGQTNQVFCSLDSFKVKKFVFGKLLKRHFVENSLLCFLFINKTNS